jgi:hypothetical protein
MKKNLSFILFLLLFLNSKAQTSWSNINLPNAIAQFQILDSNLIIQIDSSKTIVYECITLDSIKLNSTLTLADSSFLYYLNLDAVEDSMWYNAGDTLANPAIMYGQVIQGLFDTLYNYNYYDLPVSNPLVTGREYWFSFNDESSNELFSAICRVYYNGHDFMSFSICSPQTTNSMRFKCDKKSVLQLNNFKLKAMAIYSLNK